jgi:hypothetical protein
LPLNYNHIATGSDEPRAEGVTKVMPGDRLRSHARSGDRAVDARNTFLATAHGCSPDRYPVSDASRVASSPSPPSRVKVRLGERSSQPRVEEAQRLVRAISGRGGQSRLLRREPRLQGGPWSGPRRSCPILNCCRDGRNSERGRPRERLRARPRPGTRARPRRLRPGRGGVVRAGARGSLVKCKE